MHVVELATGQTLASQIFFKADPEYPKVCRYQRVLVNDVRIGWL